VKDQYQTLQFTNTNTLLGFNVLFIWMKHSKFFLLSRIYSCVRINPIYIQPSQVTLV
jgi:hypothetical protein